MLAYVKGILEEKLDGCIVVDNGGIGYEINTSYETINSLPEVGSDIKIFTKLIPKEDSITLYGFYTKAELAMFEMLLTVSGIGPKGALSILSSMTVEDIKFAIAGEDSKAFAKVPGVGKKTAERAIIDLKDKIDVIGAFDSKLSSGVNKAAKGVANNVRQEVLEALVSLGYSQSTAAKALDQMTILDSTTTEQLLSDTLKQMSFL